jgi:hypothetical protein
MAKNVEQLLQELPKELPFLWVEYDTPTHIHAALCERGEGAEAAAELLVAAIEQCDESRHDGHGRTHTAKDSHDGYYEAIRQVLTGKAEVEYKEHLHNMALDAIWGGAHPELVILPTEDGRDWNVMVTDHQTGMPVTYRMRDNVFQDMPGPREAGAIKLGEFGWMHKPQLPLQTRMRRSRSK